jgi:DNA polymerase-3 subunit beta
MKAADLHELISRVSFAVSTEESRPILNGVLWQLRPDSTTMVATNGHRLARLKTTLEGVGAPEADLIIPPKALQQVQRLFGSDEAPERAATFMPASGAPDYLCLVMPLRLLD